MIQGQQHFRLRGEAILIKITMFFEVSIDRQKFKKIACQLETDKSLKRLPVSWSKVEPESAPPDILTEDQLRSCMQFSKYSLQLNDKRYAIFKLRIPAVERRNTKSMSNSVK